MTLAVEYTTEIPVLNTYSVRGFLALVLPSEHGTPLNTNTIRLSQFENG